MSAATWTRITTRYVLEERQPDGRWVRLSEHSDEDSARAARWTAENPDWCWACDSTHRDGCAPLPRGQP